jgi:hypothetical protein
LIVFHRPNKHCVLFVQSFCHPIIGRLRIFEAFRSGLLDNSEFKISDFLNFKLYCNEILKEIYGIASKINFKNEHVLLKFKGFKKKFTELLLKFKIILLITILSNFFENSFKLKILNQKTKNLTGFLPFYRNLGFIETYKIQKLK